GGITGDGSDAASRSRVPLDAGHRRSVRRTARTSVFSFFGRSRGAAHALANRTSQAEPSRRRVEAPVFAVCLGDRYAYQFYVKPKDGPFVRLLRKLPTSRNPGAPCWPPIDERTPSPRRPTLGVQTCRGSHSLFERRRTGILQN